MSRSNRCVWRTAAESPTTRDKHYISASSASTGRVVHATARWPRPERMTVRVRVWPGTERRAAGSTGRASGRTMERLSDLYKIYESHRHGHNCSINPLSPGLLTLFKPIHHHGGKRRRQGKKKEKRREPSQGRTEENCFPSVSGEKEKTMNRK